jgi:TPR repeat protein
MRTAVASLFAASLAALPPAGLAAARDGEANAAQRPLPGAQERVVVDPAVLPEIPVAPVPYEGGAFDLAVDPNVLVAYDHARTVEAQGKERPAEAAAAWKALAELGGQNPFREMADARAGQWQAYAESKRAFEAQLARDSSRLRKVLPLASVTDSTKLDLLLRYARAYGMERAGAFVALLPAPALRDQAGLVLGCEAKQAAKCMALAHAADLAKDPEAALDYLDRACGAGAGEACAEAGERWLRAQPREAGRAISALQRGCALDHARSCARLARVYEGDGAPPDPVLAAELREKACAVGDGKSCRRMACSLDGGDDLADQARATLLWEKGCANGDATSCILVKAAAPQEAPAAAPPAPTAVAEAKAPSCPAPAASVAVAGSDERARRTRVGVLLLGAGIAAVGGVAFLSTMDDLPRSRHFHRGFVTELREGGGPSRTPLTLALGAAAALFTGAGVAVLLSRPEPAAPGVSLGVAPGGLVLSGTLP